MTTTNDAVIAGLGAGDEIALLRARLDVWLATVDEELQEPLGWALSGAPKHFRPLTVFAAHRAVNDTPPSEALDAAFAIELIHNMSLIIDDVLDGSDERRGVVTIERRYGRLPALMSAGYLVADAFVPCASDPFAVEQLSALLRRLGAAECLQWRLRRHPLGVEDWRRIAGEDTGSMFETAAVLGARSARLRRFGHLLGVLYHGCDDVGDLRGLDALGGGGEEDIRDGILTLPAALAIREPRTRVLFMTDDDDDDGTRLAELAEACRAQLAEAECVLDEIASAARAEANQFATRPQPLLDLVDEVRQLSCR